MALIDGRPAAHHVEQALEYADRYLPADALNHEYCPCGEHSCEKRRQASSRASLALSVLAAEIRSLRAIPALTTAGCLWTYNDDGFWSTECGASWCLDNDDTPSGNGMKFCHACGKTLLVFVEAPTPASEGE